MLCPVIYQKRRFRETEHTRWRKPTSDSRTRKRSVPTISWKQFSGAFLSEKMSFPQFPEVGIIVLGGHFKKYQVYNKDYEK
jgi:hypothetical protein